MWKQNFMFIQTGATPIDKTENELFHDVPQAMDSAGLNGERYISVWVQGEEKNGKPVMYTNIYARTAILHTGRQTGLLQPLQGRPHPIQQPLRVSPMTRLRGRVAKTPDPAAG